MTATTGPGHYASSTFRQRCEEAGIRPSTGRTGSCFDNAVTESFFASLETEFIDHTTFRMRRHAEQAVFAYSEGFYNPRRRHSANGHLSPAEYERRHAAGTPNVPSSRPNTGLPANGGTAAGPCRGRAGHRAGARHPPAGCPDADASGHFAYVPLRTHLFDIPHTVRRQRSAHATLANHACPGHDPLLTTRRVRRSGNCK
ncbi:integrase core domain-containing protein [Streptomyces sp. RK75]|nr:integrase core domain-containing protein [Streptomyces sp. RK75]